MKQLIKAEFMKCRRTVTNKIMIVTPLFVFAIAYILTGGAYQALPAGTWNWWYTLFLPGSLALVCLQVITRDKKKKYHTIFQMPIDPRKTWVAKVAVCSAYMLVANVLLCITAVVGGTIYGTYIPVTANLLATVVLTLTTLWAIPLFLFLAAKFGMLLCVLSGVLLTLVGVIAFAPSPWWWAYIPAIPVRLMTPILTILPNGVPAQAGSRLLDFGVVLPGVIISLVIFGLLTMLTANWFAKREEV